MIEEIQSKATGEKVELPVFIKSWPMYGFKQELAKAVTDPNIKYIGWSSAEEVRKVYGAEAGGSYHQTYINLYDKHLPKNVKKYTERWGVEPREVAINPSKRFEVELIDDRYTVVGLIQVLKY